MEVVMIFLSFKIGGSIFNYYRGIMLLSLDLISSSLFIGFICCG